ncbi:hypothetical protein FCI23_40745 [Actinacidiphila oryziradicis]|uniref:Uncharacterized protein n=1 Tax=Actinacidiphila oryziradicis TaxID=2571141 RepID=A0A4U0S2Y7_9ACTN|nr:hypothetical protein FCI23_40745 [Actinacidiphila oryziradicis]
MRGRPATVDRKPWVSDQVHDEDAARSGIVTDVRSGTYVIRPLQGPGEWTSEDSKKLTTVVPREERQDA